MLHNFGKAKRIWKKRIEKTPCDRRLKELPSWKSELYKVVRPRKHWIERPTRYFELHFLRMTFWSIVSLHFWQIKSAMEWCDWRSWPFRGLSIIIKQNNDRRNQHFINHRTQQYQSIIQSQISRKFKQGNINNHQSTIFALGINVLSMRASNNIHQSFHVLKGFTEIHRNGDQ
jgi:hypothetical protein